MTSKRLGKSALRSEEGDAACQSRARGTYPRMTLARRAARGLLRLVPGDRPSPPPIRIEDETLIDAIERGDPQLGGGIYERPIRVVDSTLYRIVGPGDRDHDD